MKKVFVFLVLSLLMTGVYAREKGSNPYYERGYMGNVSVSLCPDIENVVSECVLATSHGYSFGQGLYLGGGVGVNFAEKISVPVFTEIKYSFLQEKYSPYVGCRLGYNIYEEYWSSFICPSMGLDISRFSVFVSYDCSTLRKSVRIGAAWNF